LSKLRLSNEQGNFARGGDEDDLNFRTIFAMLLIVALAIIWNAMGGR
jgi:hypothetical protein